MPALGLGQVAAEANLNQGSLGTREDRREARFRRPCRASAVEDQAGEELRVVERGNLRQAVTQSQTGELLDVGGVDLLTCPCAGSAGCGGVAALRQLSLVRLLPLPCEVALLRRCEAAQLLVDLTNGLVDEGSRAEDDLGRPSCRQPRAGPSRPARRGAPLRRVAGETALKPEDTPEVFSQGDPHR